jgi:hypothetical protein
MTFVVKVAHLCGRVKSSLFGVTVVGFKKLVVMWIGIFVNHNNYTNAFSSRKS